MAEAKAPTSYFPETEASVSAWIANRTHRLAKNLLDPYRPELHYMRGPGPKWREKHGQQLPGEAPAVGTPGTCEAGT